MHVHGQGVQLAQRFHVGQEHHHHATLNGTVSPFVCLIHNNEQPEQAADKFNFGKAPVLTKTKGCLLGWMQNMLCSW
jgi:hypothetical protein